MIPEADAKSKWCPLARVVDRSRGSGAFNRVAAVGEGYDLDVNTEQNHCIASACMAWRWNVEIGEYPNNMATPSKTHGFCGAFGETMLAVARA